VSGKSFYLHRNQLTFNGKKVRDKTEAYFSRAN